MGKKLRHLLETNMTAYFLVMACFVVAAGLMKCYLLCAAEGIVTLVLFGVYRFLRVSRRKALASFVESLASSRESVDAVPFPSCLVQPQTGEILWYNSDFAGMAELSGGMNSYFLEELFPGIDLAWLKNGNREAPRPVSFGTRQYRLSGAMYTQDSAAVAALYFVDETQLLLLQEEYTASRPVVCVILIDNYDELTNNLSDSTISSLNASMDSRIKHWADGIGGLLRKTERNRYLFLLEARQLTTMTEQKFSILESIRSVTNPQGVHATISLGIGKDGDSVEEGYTFANLGIDMALARGGDQAVIKDRYNFSFFGGRSRETDRHTMVKSRVMASNLSQLISQSSRVFLMGHKNADLDSLGAACGIVCICRKLGKTAHIVIDRERNASAQLLRQIEKEPSYRGCLISGQDALLMADPKSLLVVVDTNRPDQVESQPLLDCIGRICIIDHHRRAADYIERNVVLNLHDPFASSASELVTELLQYSVEAKELLELEAQALLSGIVLDTKNFGMRTSSRTFEAAAFLRRLGADTSDVKRILQNDKNATFQRYQIVEQFQTYRKSIAMAALEKPVTRVVAAQAADELLTIAGITTSFVLYPDTTLDKVIISARSFGDVNVQVILEPLGGGGNAAIAGAQIPGTDVSGVLSQLISSIDRYFDAG